MNNEILRPRNVAIATAVAGVLTLGTGGIKNANAIEDFDKGGEIEVIGNQLLLIKPTYNGMAGDESRLDAIKKAEEICNIKSLANFPVRGIGAGFNETIVVCEPGTIKPDKVKDQLK